MPYTSKPLTPQVLSNLDLITHIAEEEKFKVALGGGAACAMLNAEAQLSKNNLSYKEKQSVVNTINDGCRNSDIDLYTDSPVEQLTAYLQKFTGRGIKNPKDMKGYTEFIYDNLKFQVSQVPSDDFSLTGSRIVEIPRSKYKNYEISVVNPGYLTVFKLTRNEDVDPSDVMGMILRGSVARKDVEDALQEMKVKQNQAERVLQRYDAVTERAHK